MAEATLEPLFAGAWTKVKPRPGPNLLPFHADENARNVYRYLSQTFLFADVRENAVSHLCAIVKHRVETVREVGASVLDRDGRLDELARRLESGRATARPSRS